MNPRVFPPYITQLSAVALLTAFSLSIPAIASDYQSTATPLDLPLTTTTPVVSRDPAIAITAEELKSGPAQPSSHTEKNAEGPEDKSTSELSSETLDVAKDIGLLQLIEDFKQKRSEALAKTSSPRSLDTVYLHSKINGLLLATSLEVRGTIAQINQEITESQELLFVLQQKTSRNVELAEILNFMNTGVAETISTGVGLSTQALQLPAAFVGAYGGVMEISLSALALKLEQGKRVNSQLQPNMLAKVFGREGGELAYPPAVWAYLNDRDPGFPVAETRLEKLVHHWIKAKHVPAPASRSGKSEIPVLTGNLAKRKGIDINLLQRRIMMLNDLRASISELDEELLKLVLWWQQML